jgi:hypothetical protein
MGQKSTKSTESTISSNKDKPLYDEDDTDESKM